MKISEFIERPSENDEFLPVILSFIRRKGFVPIRVDGVFDVLVTNTRDGVDKYLELKVRLGSTFAKGAVPITPGQWKFFKEVPQTLLPRFRVFFYDHAARKYCILPAEKLKRGLSTNTPSDTSYVSRTFLSRLHWMEPAAAFEALSDWLAGPLRK